MQMHYPYSYLPSILTCVDETKCVYHYPSGGESQGMPKEIPIVNFFL